MVNSKGGSRFLCKGGIGIKGGAGSAEVNKGGYWVKGEGGV